MDVRTWTNPTPMTYALACGLGAPVLLALVGTVMVLTQRAHLPSPLANQWESDVVTATVGLGAFLTVTALELVAVAALGTLLALRMPASTRPMLVGTVVALATFLGLAGYGMVLGQRGLSAAAQAVNPSSRILGAGLLGIIAGLATAYGYPRPQAPRRRQRPPAQAERLSGTVPPRRLMVRVTPAPILAAVYLGLIVGALVVLLTSHAAWWLVVAATVLAVGVASMVLPVVTIDRGGVRVRGLGLVPWLTVPAGEIHWADAITDPHAPQGLRSRSGVVTYRVSPGPALRLHLHDGTVAIISAPGADRGAAVVNTLLDDETAVAHT